LRDLMSL